jgi:hypothetical protein
VSPGRFDQLITGENAASIADQCVEQPKLLGRNLQRPAGPPKLRAVEVHFAIAELELPIGRTLSAAQLRTDACTQFAQTVPILRDSTITTAGTDGNFELPGQDVTHTLLDLTSGATRSLEIVLSPTAAEFGELMNSLYRGNVHMT